MSLSEARLGIHNKENTSVFFPLNPDSDNYSLSHFLPKILKTKHLSQSDPYGKSIIKLF
jgi:hypothetical protein